jgi:hypothetical protein
MREGGFKSCHKYCVQLRKKVSYVKNFSSSFVTRQESQDRDGRNDSRTSCNLAQKNSAHTQTYVHTPPRHFFNYYYFSNVSFCVNLSMVVKHTRTHTQSNRYKQKNVHTSRLFPTAKLAQSTKTKLRKKRNKPNSVVVVVVVVILLLLLLFLIVTYFMKPAGQLLFLMEGTMGNFEKHM